MVYGNYSSDYQLKWQLLDQNQKNDLKNQKRVSSILQKSNLSFQSGGFLGLAWNEYHRMMLQVFVFETSKLPEFWNISFFQVMNFNGKEYVVGWYFAWNVCFLVTGCVVLSESNKLCTQYLSFEQTNFIRVLRNVDFFVHVKCFLNSFAIGFDKNPKDF